MQKSGIGFSVIMLVVKMFLGCCHLWLEAGKQFMPLVDLTTQMTFEETILKHLVQGCKHLKHSRVSLWVCQPGAPPLLVLSAHLQDLFHHWLHPSTFVICVRKPYSCNLQLQLLRCRTS